MLRKLSLCVAVSVGTIISMILMSAIPKPGKGLEENSFFAGPLIVSGPMQDDKDKRIIEFLNADPEYKKLSAEEQELFYWVNFVRLYPSKFWDQYASPLITKQKRNQYTNSLKRDLEKMSPVGPLKVSAALQDASNYHANDMIRSKKFQHNSSNGESFDKRLKRFGSGSTIAENIHLGAGTPFRAVLALLIDERVAGSGHRENILSPDYNAAGMSYKTYQDKKILVQDFGKIN